jgi:hypothetical protein
VGRDLLGAALCGDVLGLRQLCPSACASAVAGQADEILGHDRDGAARAFLPWCIGGRVDHDLAHDPPTGVVRVAAGNKKPSQCIGNALRFRLGRMAVEMPERVADVAAVVYRPCELASCTARSVLLFLDTSTVLTMSKPSRGYACNMPIPRIFRGKVVKEEPVLIGDPRVEGWESVGMFEDQATAVAWRDQLRLMGVSACCVADHPLDRGRGDIFLVVPPDQWSQATEIVDNLE